MAKQQHRRFADLDYGHPGILTYIPAARPEDGPGLLHTSRRTAGSLQFNIIGSSAELYPPSRSPAPSASSQLWSERQLQRRWLLNTHPEAFMGNPCLQEYLKEDMERFRRAEEAPHRGQLLAVGQMSDMRNADDVRGVPLLAVAAGESGEQLRLVRIDESLWQWDENQDAVLHLSVVDAVDQEEETMWVVDALPILRIKAAVYVSSSNSVRWLLVQKSTSTTILQPEYHPVPVSDSGTAGEPAHQRASFINPNALLTLHHRQTGGNAHSDMSLNPAVPGRPAQLTVLDECGYWSVWNILGTLQVGKKTLRLSQHKCGHIFEGVLDAIPPRPAYPAERHGILHVGRWEADQDIYLAPRRVGSLQSMASPSQYILLWNAERFELLDLDSDTWLPKLQLLVHARTQSDRILDVQRSPLNDNHVFVLTTRQVLWVDLFCHDKLSEAPPRPAILLSCSHIGFDNKDMLMATARASADDADTALVLTYLPRTDQLCVYWFGLATVAKLPQWHRHATQLLGGRESPWRPEMLRVQPAKLETSADLLATGPGSSYLRSGIKFYQVSILGEDLGVRYCICTASSGAPLDVTLPMTRLGWSRSEKRRRWKKKRKHFLRHMGETFVLPDSMSDADLAAILRRRDREESPRPAPGRRLGSVRQPVLLKLDLICQAVREHLDLAAAQEDIGLSAALAQAIRGALEQGQMSGSLPLTTWAEIADGLGHAEGGQTRPKHDAEDEAERLFDMSDERTMVTQLRRRSPKEPPNSLLSFSALKHDLSELWLAPAADKLPKELQQIRELWVSEVARDLFLSSCGIMVQDVPLLEPGSSTAADEGYEDESTMQPTLPCHRSAAAAASPAGATPTPAPPSAAPDAALQRLKLLVPALEPGKLGATQPAKVLSYWPTERGVGTQDYLSSVAEATEEQFREARQRRQRIEARRKAQAERRPAFMRQGFPMSDDGPGLPRRPRPVHAAPPLSSQELPASSQTQGLEVTMSQPVAGPFGGREMKKGKRKRGFR